ncbi:MAG: polysulfide reductase NrfD [Anaerolineales bacterium]|nr:polysulfide reductase NrfD [Anaerolineales bacterium]
MTTDTMAKKGEGIPLAWWVVLAVLVVAGIAAWVVQLTQGMGVTGLNQQIVWGLYIAGFFTAAGGGAGLLALVGLSEFQPLVPKEARPKLLSLALAGFVTAGVLIVMDIGVPLRSWRLVTSFNFNAIETLDFWLLAISVVVTLIYLLQVRKGAGTKGGLGALGVVSAAALVVVESLMLGGLAARPMWGSLTVFGFLVSAAIAGAALVMIALPGETGMKAVKGVLVAGLGINLVLVIVEVITGLVSGSPRLNEEIGSMLAGAASPFFWVHVVVGLLLPLYLLWSASKVRAWVIGALVLVGVLADKLWVLVAGQEKPWLALPAAGYFPTWVEFVVLIGVVAIGALVYLLVLRIVEPRGTSAA